MSDRVYLAGPIFGCTDETATSWRSEASRLLGARVFDPMDRDYRGQEVGNEAKIVYGDLHDILESRAMLVWAESPSWGAAMEIVYASQLGKRIVAVVPNGKVSPWLRFHATAVVSTIEEAVQWIG